MIEKKIAPCIADVFEVGIAFFVFDYCSVITISNTFSYFVHGGEHSVSIAINLIGLTRKTFACRFRLICLKFSTNLAQLQPSDRRHPPCAA